MTRRLSVSVYLCTGAASVAVEHAEQHPSRLQARGCAAAIFDGSVGWQLITFETHHRRHIFPIKLWHLGLQHE